MAQLRWRSPATLLGILFVYSRLLRASASVYGAAHIAWHNGKLSFTQFRAGAEDSDSPVFTVAEKVNWATLDKSMGVTIVFNTETHSLELKGGVDTTGIAWGHLADNLDKNGWIELYIQATQSSRVTNDLRTFAAGYIEGALTAARISQFYSNTHQILLRDEAANDALQNIKLMFHDEIEFVKKNTNIRTGMFAVEPNDPYWKQARYMLFQVWGIRDGYNAKALQAGVHGLTLADMWAINNHALMPELMQEYLPKTMMQRRKLQQHPSLLAGPSVTRTQPPGLRGFSKHMQESPSRNLTDVAAAAGDTFLPADHRVRKANATELALADRDWERRLASTGHCSGFVRIAPENDDLLIGHTTWDDYNKMTRIFKYYKIDLPGSATAASHIGMSSYPGCVSSTDHFYMMNSGLAVFDTSLEILNPTVYNRIPEFPTNSHLPSWMHVMIANRMSHTAVHWTVLFGERNNGQDNAQWMIVDYNKFSPGRPLKPDTLWVLEQIPGKIAKADMSEHLRKNGYWASYNRPFFADIRADTGHTAAEKFYGPIYSYANNPRATIFSRIENSANTLMGVRLLMDRNNFQNEGVTPKNPGHAISARNDLDPVNHIPNGGIDAKVTSHCLFKALQCQAISGPSHESEPIFSWAAGGVELFPGWPHIGLPNTWGFDWVQMTPARSLEKIVDVRKC